MNCADALEANANTCGAELHIGDDFGDNVATVRCQLAKGHALPHVETFQRAGLPVVITFACDEREAETDGDV